MVPIYNEQGRAEVLERIKEVKGHHNAWGSPSALSVLGSATFCYGPKSCPLYKAGPTRKVPGHRGIVWEEKILGR